MIGNLITGGNEWYCMISITNWSMSDVITLSCAIASTSSVWWNVRSACFRSLPRQFKDAKNILPWNMLSWLSWLFWWKWISDYFKWWRNNLDYICWFHLIQEWTKQQQQSLILRPTSWVVFTPLHVVKETCWPVFLWYFVIKI